MGPNTAKYEADLEEEEERFDRNRADHFAPSGEDDVHVDEEGTHV